MLKKQITCFVLCLFVLVAHAKNNTTPPTPIANQIQHWVTDKNTRVYYMHNPNIPMVDVRVLFDAGSARDKRAGVANFTNAMLDMGVYANGERPALNENDITDAFDALGAYLSFNTTRDTASVSFRSLSEPEKLWQGLNLFERVLNTPSFPKDVITRDRARFVRSLSNSEIQPQTMLGLLFTKAVYGEHPYAHPVSGSSETVGNITRLHLKQFHKKYYVASNAVIVIVGDVNKADAQRIARTLTAHMPKGATPHPIEMAKLSNTPLDEKKSTVFVPMDTEQSQIAMGHVGLTMNDPDFYDLFVANHVFGGSGFSSVLVKDIREDKGLAYSVYSSLSRAQGGGVFSMGMQTKVASTDEAVALLKKHVVDFGKTPVSDAQLARAVKNITGSTPMRTDSNSKWLGFLSSVGRYELPHDFLDTFNTRIKAVTPQSIQEAWQRRIKPEQLVTVIVGGETDTPQNEQAEQGDTRE